MNKLIVAAIAGVFAATVSAQTTAPAPADASKDKQQTNKEKQETVKAATKDIGHGPRAANASAEAAKSKNTPKALPTTKDKQDASKAVLVDKGYGPRAAEGSAKAAADTSPRKPPPKPQVGSPEMKKESTP